MKQESVRATLLSDETTGIYESLRTYGGVFFRAEDHLDRFYESAKTVGLKIPENRQELLKTLKKSLADSGKKEAFIRITLLGEKLFIIVTEKTHPPKIYEKGVALRTSPVPRNLSQAAFPEAKSTACLNQVLGTLDPAPAGNYELLFLNSGGYLTEARIGNLFIVASGHLLTPPPNGLLNGVTRRFVIECARLGKIPVEERPITRHELFNAQEAFLTNTSWEILPIREVDAREIGFTRPGPITRKLQAIFRRQVRKEIRNAKN